MLETQGSAELLRQLEASNLFVVPLDDHREWYRYHQLFADLLRLQLGAREPELVPVLHRRAAAWHHAAGQVDEAIGHASAAGDLAEAGTLIARHWASHWLGGQRATVARWLKGLPEAAILADPPVASAARSYWESGRATALAAGQAPPEVSLLVGFTTFPGETWRSRAAGSRRPTPTSPTSTRPTGAATSPPGKSTSCSPTRSGPRSGRFGR